MSGTMSHTELKLAFHGLNFTKDLTEPIILKPNTKYSIKFVNANVHDVFYANLFLNDIKIQHFGNDGSYRHCEDVDYEVSAFQFMSKKAMPLTIENIRIQIIPNITPGEFHHSEFDYNLEFVIERMELPCIANIEKDECCICYSETFTSTNCKHYICNECFDKIVNSNSCPYCTQSLGTHMNFIPSDNEEVDL